MTSEVWALIGILFVVAGIILGIVGYITDSGTCLVLCVVSFILMFVCVIGTNVSDSSESRAIYNNGIHAEDGGHWEFKSMATWRGLDTYVYECDKCGKMLKSPVLFDEVK